MDIAVTNKSCNVLFLSQKRFLQSYVAGVVLILEYFDLFVLFQNSGVLLFIISFLDLFYKISD